MSLFRHLRALSLMGALAVFLTTEAGAQYEIKGGVFNRISNRAGGIPVGPTGIPSGEPTILPQFSNLLETSASAGPISNSATLSARYPASPAVVLQHASLGNSFASGVPRYFLGDRITPPASYVNDSGAVVTTSSDFWRPEPIRPAEIVTNPSTAPLKDSTGADIQNSGGVIVPALAEGMFETFYYSPHAKSVFANQSGQVQIWWRSRSPDSAGNYILVKEIFSVSSATTAPVRTFYWTEKSFNGPRVTIPSGRIVTVNVVYSNVFPATVAEEYQVVGSTPPADPDAQPASELRTVWFEKTNGIGELHAYNVSGRLLVEYLGKTMEDGSREFLGADVVEVAQSADFTTLTVNLGDEIRPAIEDPKLSALPVDSSGTTEAVAYYGSNVRADGSLAYYAERENNLEDRVVFYWLETLDASIHPSSAIEAGLELDWPKYLHKYLQVWPEGVLDFAHYTVGKSGSSEESGTGLKFEGGEIPTLVYQDDLEQDEAVLDALSQRIFVGLGGDQLNRTLLKFSGDNGGVWYVRLMTQAQGREGFMEGDGGSVLTGAAYVGRRIEPPSGDYSLAGYVAGGSGFSPGAYKDPFQAGIAEAETAAIIPVNALPGSSNSITVWWFKRIAAPSSEFPDFYTPAKIGTYSVAYRGDDPKIVLASNSGSGDLPTDQIAGSIYVQNDAAKPGFNPNEEHALMLGGRAYALREDLTVTTQSGFT